MKGARCLENILAYNSNAGGALSKGVELEMSFQAASSLRIDWGGSWIDAKLTEDVVAIGARKGNRLAGAPKVNANLGLTYELNIGRHEASVRMDSIYIGPFYGDILESQNSKAGDYIRLDASTRVRVRGLNIDLFVRNLTNEDAFAFRSTGTASEFYGYRLQPRTVGVQLGYAL